MPPRLWRDPPRSYTAFEGDVARLRKKFRHFDDDLGKLKEHLALHACEREGGNHVPVPNSLGVPLWKIRCGNKDKNAGKSGGYRLLYIENGGDTVVPVRMYDKSEAENLPPADVKDGVGRLTSELAQEAPSPAEAETGEGE